MRGHMRVDVLRDNRFAILQALPTRAAAQLAELSVLRVDVTDFNLPRRFGSLGLAFAAPRCRGLPVIVRR